MKEDSFAYPLESDTGCVIRGKHLTLLGYQMIAKEKQEKGASPDSLIEKNIKIILLR